MKVSLMDRGLYFRGLLQLIRQDREVGNGEREVLLRLGRYFSFERGFCEAAIDEILSNPFMVGGPPVFSAPAIADCFLRDGMKVSGADGRIHPRELRWLRACAAGNGLDWSSYEAAPQAAVGHPEAAATEVLEAERFEWE